MNDLLPLVDGLKKANAFDSLSPPLQTALFLGVLAFVPALLVCLTAYTRVVIVLSFVRRAVTSQEIPPNIVVIGLSLFLTLFIMGPTLEEVNGNALAPYLEGKITGSAAYEQGAAAVRKFMLRQTRKQDLALFLHLAKSGPVADENSTPTRVLVPAFMISELKTAFIMGFCLYLPFLLVDLVVASILTSLGMITLPPVTISAPFKILLFVLADGWHLVVFALGGSFG